MIQCTTPRLAYPTAGRLRDRQEAQHEEDHPLHNQPVQEGQDMAVAGEAEQEAVPGRSTPHSVSSTDLPLSQIMVALDDSSTGVPPVPRHHLLSTGSAPGSPSDTGHCLSCVIKSNEDVRDVGGWSL